MKRLLALAAMVALLLCGACAQGARADDGSAQAPPSLRLEDDTDLSQGLYDGYFTDAVFIGDSLTGQLRRYVKLQEKEGVQLLGGARFLTADSYTVKRAARDSAAGLQVSLRYRGYNVTPGEGLRQMGAKRVFILLGHNDHAGYRLEEDISYYGKMIDGIRAACPDIEVICQAVSPIQKHMQSGLLKQRYMDAFNAALAQLCEEKGVKYLDIATPLMDESGYLPAENALKQSDNVHLSGTGVRVWIDTLRRFAREQYEAGLWSPQ